MILLAILGLGLFTMWVEAPWAWAAEQVAIFGLAAWYLFTRRPLPWRASMIPLAAIVMLAGVQLFAGSTADRWETTGQLYTWVAWLAAHWVAIATLDDDEARERFLDGVVYLGVAIAVLAIAHRTTSQGKVLWWFDTGRKFVMGVFPYENQYAAFILAVLPRALQRALRKGANRWGWIAGAAVMIASVVSSSSVAGAALVLVEALVVLWMASAALHWPWKPRAALMAGILAAAAVFGSVSGWGDIVSDLERKSAMEVRRQLTLSTIEMAQARPVAGWGLGTWTEIYPAYARFDDGLYDNAAHNDWAQWASDGGVPMLVLMAFFAALIAMPAVRFVWGIGLLFVLGYSLIEFHFQERPQFGCFFFALAGAVVARKL